MRRFRRVAESELFATSGRVHGATDRRTANSSWRITDDLLDEIGDPDRDAVQAPAVLEENSAGQAPARVKIDGASSPRPTRTWAASRSTRSGKISYRLSVLPITIPLRDRRDDIPPRRPFSAITAGS
jgi:DNA-binding NtrC family response regulator